MHVNTKKIQLEKKQMLFLGYDVFAGLFSLNTYVQEQKTKLPKVSSRTKIRRILGVFNICRGSCSDLARWVQPLQELLKAEQLPTGEVLVEITQRIWEKVVEHGTALCLDREPREFHLMVDYSSTGCGYVLFSKAYKDGRVVGMNSKSNKEGPVSSYLGELQGICWALNETKGLVQERKLVLWTDSESAYKRIKRCDIDFKCLYDVRVAQLLSCLWANFTAEQLEVKFIPGEYNGIADMLSCWSCKVGVGGTGNSNPEEKTNGKDKDEVQGIQSLS